MATTVVNAAGAGSPGALLLLPDDIVALFNSYLSAYGAGDSARIAEHYTLPRSILDANGPQVFVSAVELEEKLETYLAYFAAADYRGAEFSQGSFEHLGDRAARVDLGWRVFIKPEPVEYRTSYVLQMERSNWRIFSATVYDGPYRGLPAGT